MARAGQIVENPVTRERLTFIRTAAESEGEVLELDLVLGPGGFVPAMHIHPLQEERFEVLPGNPCFRIGADERAASAGETLIVRPGTPHRFWNPASSEARVRIELRPALRMEQVLEETARLGRNGELNRKGLPNPLRGAVLAHEYAPEFAPAPDSQILFSRLPPRALRASIITLAAVGRLLGYRPRTDSYS